MIKGYQFVDYTTFFDIPIDKYSIFSMPLFITGFSFQMIIPGLVNHLNRDKLQIKIVIFIGTSLTAVVYIIWNIVMLNITMLDNALVLHSVDGNIPIYGIRILNFNFSKIINFFSLFSLGTSFIGIIWGFIEFLSDLLEKSFLHNYMNYIFSVGFITLIIISHNNPNIFMAAIESTGGYGDTLLNGILPIIMYWKILDILNQSSSSNNVLKKIILLILMSFATLLIFLETINILS